MIDHFISMDEFLFISILNAVGKDQLVEAHLVTIYLIVFPQVATLVMCAVQSNLIFRDYALAFSTITQVVVNRHALGYCARNTGYAGISIICWYIVMVYHSNSDIVLNIQ